MIEIKYEPSAACKKAFKAFRDNRDMTDLSHDDYELCLFHAGWQARKVATYKLLFGVKGEYK